MYIVKEMDAKIVISSSIKNDCFFDGVLSYMCRYLIDTLNPYASTREEKINLYLEYYPETGNFCILDDDYYMKKFKDNLVKLPSQMNEQSKGLDDEHVMRIIKMLRK